MDLSWHAVMKSMIQVKTLYHILKSKDLASYPWISKKKKFHGQTHPSKPAGAELSFRKVSLPLQNDVCFSLLTSELDSFGNKSTPSDKPWIEAYCPKF